MLQWWDSLVAWFSTDSGRLVLLGGIVPFAAILAAGILAAWIARGSVRRVLARRDREARAAVIGLLVDAARQASVWSSSSPGERILIERAVAEADLALRLLPARGARLAADWTTHRIAELRRASAMFSLEFDRPLADLRDRLIAWHRRPQRARRLFETDLLSWRADAADEVSTEPEHISPRPATRVDSSVVSPPAETKEGGPVAPSMPSPARGEAPNERIEPGQVERPTDEDFRRPMLPVGNFRPAE